MHKSDQSDEELMTMYQNGSESAFQILYDRHAVKIYNFIRSRITSTEISHEIFQDVFLKIHKSKHLYNPTLPVLPWVFTITRHTIFDRLKRSDKIETPQPIDEIDQIPQTIENNQNHFDLEPELTKLTPQQQQVLHLRYYDEKTFEEIADTLKTSPANIRKIVSRGIQRLKEVISDGGKS